MAFSMSSGGGGGRRGSRFRGNSSLAEINIVPLVDVVLVLLIIFMLTAHVMEFGLEVDVPQVNETRSSAQDLPVITVSKDGEYQLNDKPVNINEIGSAIEKRFPGQKAVYVRADKAVVWDSLAQVVSALGRAKKEVRMVTQPANESGRRR
jgi:biopolymer transport protein ExbD